MCAIWTNQELEDNLQTIKDSVIQMKEKASDLINPPTWDDKRKTVAEIRAECDKVLDLIGKVLEPDSLRG